MLNEQDKHQRQQDIRMLKTWLQGPHDKPCLLPHRQAYHVCSVLFPTLFSNAWFHLRHFMMFLISRLPWSAPKVFLFRRMGVRIGKGVYIAPWVILDAMFPRLIELGDHCFLGVGCTLITHEYSTRGFRIAPVRVGCGSVLGAFSIVRGGVTIGRFVNTGLGSVVFHDIPDEKTAVGNPARYDCATKVPCEL